ASCGTAWAVAAAAGVIAETPAGALVDRLPQKRELVAVAALMIAVACLAPVWVWNEAALMAAQALAGLVGAIFAPALAGIRLGLVGFHVPDGRDGRDER